jgi:glutamate dehydrogenase/leucine dehydrogenase
MKNFNENWDGRLPRKNSNDINTLSEASQQVIGKYRFTPFMENTNKEGVAGWTISIQGKGVVAYIAEPKRDSTGSPSLQRARAATSPYKIYRTKGLSFKNFFPGELKMSAYPGTENRVVSEKEIRFAPRLLIQAVAMWMDKYGTKALTEDMETTEVDEVTEETAAADGAQSLDEVQFITPKVPLTGGSNNSKAKTDYKLYVELKDVVNDVIKKLEQAESMIRSPSKNSNLSILQTVTQAKQKLKIAVK